MRVDQAAWLVADVGDPRVFRAPTSRTTPLATPSPTHVVWHWTAGFGSARSLARQAASGPGASFHIGIDRDGTVTQLAPFTVGTNHCRGRTASGVHWNACAIGIELVNVGRVIRVGSQWLQVENPHEPPVRHRPSAKVFVPPADVVAAHGGHWQNFPPAQVQSATAVLAAIRLAYMLPAAAVSLGHLDLDPDRKADPGLHFMRDVLPGIVAASAGVSAGASR